MSGKKSGKSQGILRWMISGNPDSVIFVREELLLTCVHNIVGLLQITEVY